MRAQTIAAVVNAGAAVVAVIVAGIALLFSLRTFRTTYQPLVRPVTTAVAGGLIVKNVGRGPALALTVVRHPAHSECDLVAEVDVVEPLGEPRGPKFDESTRIGRAKLGVRGPGIVAGGEYWIFYQDAAGAWHRTDFAVLANPAGGFRFETKFRGRCGPWVLRSVPEWIRQRRQIATDEHDAQV